MHLSLVLVVFATSRIGYAQFDGIPSCALNCFIGPFSTDGCSGLTDLACHCRRYDSLVASITPCVQGACSTEDQAATITSFEQTCADAGVPINQTSTAISSSTSASSLTTPQSSFSTTTLESTTTFSSRTSQTSSERSASTETTATGPVSSSSLSTGAAAGIGVGVTLAAVFVAMGAFILWRKRRARTRDAPHHDDGPAEASDKVVVKDMSGEMDPEYHEAGGSGVVPENELEDKHGLKVAREREMRSELY